MKYFFKPTKGGNMRNQPSGAAPSPTPAPAPGGGASMPQPRRTGGKGDLGVRERRPAASKAQTLPSASPQASFPMGSPFLGQ